MTTARSSSAYTASVMLHAGAVALIFILGWLVSQNRPPPPKVFELVAGGGDNLGATVAPAIGSPTGSDKITAPKMPEPVAPPHEEVQAAPPPKPVPMPPTKTAPPKADTVPNFSQTVKKQAARTESRIVKKFEAQKKKEQESYEKFLKDHPQSPSTKSSPSRAPQVDAKGLHDGVLGGSSSNMEGGQGGKALTREQQDAMDTYFAMLKTRLRENFTPPADVSDKLTATVEFSLSASGTISHARVVQSSGNAAFDRAVLDAFAQTHMPARPDHRSETGLTVPFKTHDDDAQ